MGIRMSFLRPQNGHALPEELVLTEILPKLPAKSLMRFKCVSKKWLDVIANDAHLREAHACKSSGEISSIVLAKHSGKEKHKLLFLSGDGSEQVVFSSPKVKELEISYLLGNGVQLCSEIDVIGSSNGLVLLSKSFFFHPANLILWNPATREFRYLPRADLLKYGVDFDEISGFPIFDLGFNDKNNDIKVLRVAETSLRNDDDVAVTTLNFQVFSKKADSWRKVKPLYGFRIQSWKLGVSIHGALYFLASQVTLNASHKIVVLSFRYRDDELQNPMDVPDCYPEEEEELHGNEFELARWKNDSLGLITPNQTAGNGFDFWVMVKNSDDIDGTGFHWSKLFVFDYRYPICGAWRDRFLIIQKHRRRSIELLLWDPKSDGKKRLKLAKLDCLWYFCAAINYVPSLVSVYPDR